MPLRADRHTQHPNQPKSTWVKADRRNPLVPRGTKRWTKLYRGRAAVEREFGRLKNEYGLAPLRVQVTVMPAASISSSCLAAAPLVSLARRGRSCPATLVKLPPTRTFPSSCKARVIRYAERSPYA